jgi:hypothetical protein
MPLTKLREWLSRSRAVGGARAKARAPADPRDRAARQARLLVEIAKLAADSEDALPPGSRPGALLALYREAVYWALVAARPNAEAPPGDLAALWAEHDRTARAKTAARHALDGAIADALLAFSPATVIDATDEQASHARTFAERLVTELEGPRGRFDRLIRQRWLGLLGLAVVAGAAGIGVRRLLIGPDLAAGKPFRASSTFGGCPTDPSCRGLLFHTEFESNPWVEFDLQAARRIHRVEVANRGDCCAERAMPLVIEVGNDGKAWTEIARRETEFASWVAEFPPTVTRYVRLRAARDTALHFERVAIR